MEFVGGRDLRLYRSCLKKYDAPLAGCQCGAVVLTQCGKMRGSAKVALLWSAESKGFDGTAGVLRTVVLLLSQCGNAGDGPAVSEQRGRDMAKELEHVSELESRKVAEASRETEWKQPSFLREMFLGNFRLDLIHPYPLPEQERPEFAAFSRPGRSPHAAA